MAISKLNPVAVNKRIAAFTASGTWTVPAGVTYAIAHMMGGGGGAGRGSSGTGGASSVAFAGGTVSAEGGLPLDANAAYSLDVGARAGANNSGDGAAFFGVHTTASVGSGTRFGGRGATIVAADSVTPAASITVTVGAGGAAGTNGAAGGTGYVFIEYYE